MSGTFAGFKTFVLECYNSNDHEYHGWYIDEATGWTTKESWFSYHQGQESLLQSIQTSSGAYQATCSVSTGDLSLGV